MKLEENHSSFSVKRIISERHFTF